jgi:DNA polymerase-3 subunit epsilon
VILIFDVETDGLIVKGRPPPNIVQLAAILLNESGIERASLSLIIRPDGYQIPTKVSDIHKITTEIAEACGVPLIVALGMLSNLIKLADTHIAHNAAFDAEVVAAAFGRVSRPMPPLSISCTKELATPILKLPPTAKMLAAGFNRAKAPTLSECVRHFFNEDLEGAHDAMVDVRACARVYREIQRLAAIG